MSDIDEVETAECVCRFVCLFVGWFVCLFVGSVVCLPVCLLVSASREDVSTLPASSSEPDSSTGKAVDVC